MPTDQSDDRPNLDQLQRFGASQPLVRQPVQAPAPKMPAGVTYKPGDKNDIHRGHGGDYVIDERGHRVPVK